MRLSMRLLATLKTTLALTHLHFPHHEHKFSICRYRATHKFHIPRSNAMKEELKMANRAQEKITKIDTASSAYGKRKRGESIYRSPM